MRINCLCSKDTHIHCRLWSWCCYDAKKMASDDSQECRDMGPISSFIKSNSEVLCYYIAYRVSQEQSLQKGSPAAGAHYLIHPHLWCMVEKLHWHGHTAWQYSTSTSRLGGGIKFRSQSGDIKTSGFIFIRLFCDVFKCQRTCQKLDMLSMLKTNGSV